MSKLLVLACAPLVVRAAGTPTPTPMPTPTPTATATATPMPTPMPTPHGNTSTDSGCDDQSEDTCCPGKYWTKLLLRCDPCAPGHFSTHSLDGCEVCPPGEYQDQRGQTECKSCAGQGFANAAAIRCEVCSLFEHSPAEGSGESCETCFASVVYMFSWDFCLLESIASLVLFAAVVGGGLIGARWLIRSMQEKVDAGGTKDPEADPFIG